MPTRAQLKKTYTSIVRGQAENDNLKPMCSAPAQADQMMVFKNVGIPGLKGRENIYSNGSHLYVENKSGKSTRWYDAGPAPMFAMGGGFGPI